MKIALIQCPVWGPYDPPLALAQLSSCLKKAGNEVFILDLNIKLYLNRKENYKNMWAWEQSIFWYDTAQVDKFFKDNIEDIENYIKDIINSGARIIGFSVNAASRLSSIKLARYLKQREKNLIIVFGGPIFFEKRYIDFILREDSVDIVIPNEGEDVFCELVRLIETRQDISLCKGIAFKNKGRIVKTEPRDSMVNLDNLPFLDFTDLPLNDYDDSRHIPLMASRGCIQRCAFCSSRVFWPGYRCMNGERIFKEIEFHKMSQGRLNTSLGHVDFLDLLFNGNMRSLVTFCDLMSKAKLDIYWTANMIIRPELTFDIIKKMKDSGCEHIIFGIESGSQRVLDLMNKHYQIEDADRIIRWMHKAGIIVTCNFMFGFPGETEKDFEKTLHFIKRNAEFLDRVYPSRTYCALEEYSYFHSHLKEFGVKPNPPNHLYWESIDGENTYPVRLRRCEEFCNLSSLLGIEVGCGVQTSVELDKWYNLSFYYEYKRDYRNLISCLLKYHKLDSTNEVISNKINFYYDELKKGDLSINLDGALLVDLEAAVVNMRKEKSILVTGSIAKLGRKQSVSLLRQQQKDNSQLNDKEFESRKIILSSSPKIFSFQASGPCNSHCIFCSRDINHDFFDLTAYRDIFENKLGSFLLRAEQIILNGLGEIFSLPHIEEILEYFDDNFPQAEKVFFTNGSSLTPKICKRIVDSKSRYTIYVSLHASVSNLHKVITRTDNFHKIIGQLHYLSELRKDTGNPVINFVFVATTINIEDLPNFIRLAAHLGISKVICYYNYIYIPAQRYLSCFFKQELTNRVFDEAERVANSLNIKIDLPPKFGLKDYPVNGICREPWSRVIFNTKGNIISCSNAKEINEGLTDNDFRNIWNGPYYQELRKALINGDSCFKYCFRANPVVVNELRAHMV